MAASTDVLSFPMPDPPSPGETIEVSPGLHWLSTSLPLRPGSINLWLLRDGNGWTMVDCGFPSEEARAEIESAWSKVLGSYPVNRLIVTHHHPDHAGNCRWICERWGIVPTMTPGEHEMAQVLLGERWGEYASARQAFWLRHGLPEAAALEFHENWRRHRSLFSPMPDGWHAIEDGDVVRTDGCDWQVIVSQGHSPAQALLYSAECKLLISGDQVLARINPNVSIIEDRPPRNPSALFLQSNRRLAQVCTDVLVLPSHQLPFFGLHSRIEALEKLRYEKLTRLEDQLKRGPQTAADLLPALFGNLNYHEIVFALGEVIAQLQHLVEEDRAKQISRDGRYVFASC